MKKLLVVAFALALGSLAFAEGEAAPTTTTETKVEKTEKTKVAKKTKKAKKGHEAAPTEAPATSN